MSTNGKTIPREALLLYGNEGVGDSDGDRVDNELESSSRRTWSALRPTKFTKRGLRELRNVFLKPPIRCRGIIFQDAAA